MTDCFVFAPFFFVFRPNALNLSDNYDLSFTYTCLICKVVLMLFLWAVFSCFWELEYLLTGCCNSLRHVRSQLFRFCGAYFFFFSFD